MQTKDKIAFIDKYLIPIIFGAFVVCIILAFAEHALYFRKTLVKTFAVPPPPKPISVDLITLTEVARAININEKNLRLLNLEVQEATAVEPLTQKDIIEAVAPPQAEGATAATTTQEQLKKPNR